MLPVLLSACLDLASPLPATSPPPRALAVVPTDLVEGAAVDVTVENAVDLATLRGAAARGTTCPAAIAPACLPLRAPLYDLGTEDAGFDGRPVLRVALPAGLPLTSIEVAAVSRRNGQPVVSAAVTMPVLRGAGDADGDGLTNAQEATHGTSLRSADTDGDGLTDADEVRVWRSSPLDRDSDDDGLTDADEVRRYGTSPVLADTDGDALDDREELTSWRYGRTSPTDPDSDDDGLDDGAERAAGTRATDPDSDDDGRLDGAEVRDGTDPLDRWSPLPYDAVDTGGEDTGLPACPPGMILNCWGACAWDTRRDTTCERWLDCPRYHADFGACDGDEAGACAAGSVLGCWGTCEPATLGDGACDPALACPTRAWDGGDCPAPAGRTLTGFLEVDDPADLARLAGVARLDGTLRLLAGAPAVVTLPDLEVAGAIEVAADADVTLVAPALTLVERDVRDDGGLAALDAPALRTVGGALRVTGAAAVALPSLAQVGGPFTLAQAYGLVVVDLPALRYAGGIIVDGAAAAPVTLPALLAVGGDVTISDGLSSFDAPALTRIDGRLAVFRQPIARVSAPLARARDGVLASRACRLTRLDVGDVGEGAGVLLNYDVRRYGGADCAGWTEVTLGATALTSLQAGAAGIDAPSLRALGSLRLDAGALDAPLAEVTWLDVERGGDVLLPATSRATGTVELRGGRLDLSGAAVIDLAVAGDGSVALAAGPVDGATLRIAGRGGLVVDAPGLRSADAIVISGGTLRAGALTSADSLGVVRWWYGPLDSFGDGAVALDLPALADLGALHIARFPGAGPIVLPALARAASVYVSEAPALTALDLPALTDTKGVYVHGAGALARLDLGALERAGLGVASVSLPGTPAADGIKVEDAPALTSLDLGALREVATLWLLGLPLGALDLPSLVEADTIRFGEDSAIAWNQVTTPRLTGPVTPMDVVLPSLVRVGDAFFLHDRRIRRFDAPQLTAVDAYLRLHDLPNLATVRLPSLVDAAPGWLSFVHDPALLTVDLPALRTVGRLAAVDTALAAVDLPGLELATDQLTAYDNPALTSLRLPAVTASSALYLDHNPALVAIDLASLASTGSVWVGGHAALTALSLPALVEVATSVDVRDNPVLAALSLPALRRAGEVHVVGQPALDRCAVEAELADVAVAGEVEVDGGCGR